MSIVCPRCRQEFKNAQARKAHALWCKDPDPDLAFQDGEAGTQLEALAYLALSVRSLRPGFEQDFFFSVQFRVCERGRRLTIREHEKLLELAAIVRGRAAMARAPEPSPEEMEEVRASFRRADWRP